MERTFKSTYTIRKKEEKKPFLTFYLKEVYENFCKILTFFQMNVYDLRNDEICQQTNYKFCNNSIAIVKSIYF